MDALDVMGLLSNVQGAAHAETIEDEPVGWRLVGVKIKDGPPNTGGRQQVLAK
jgi:hypothetical protein